MAELHLNLKNCVAYWKKRGFYPGYKPYDTSWTKHRFSTGTLEQCWLGKPDPSDALHIIDTTTGDTNRQAQKS